MPTPFGADGVNVEAIRSFIRLSPGRSGLGFATATGCVCCWVSEEVGEVGDVDGFAPAEGEAVLPEATRARAIAKAATATAARDRGDPPGHPGGHACVLPASTCRWAWNTDCPASAPVLNTSR